MLTIGIKAQTGREGRGVGGLTVLWGPPLQKERKKKDRREERN